jgi:hypothetical protein
LIKCGVSVALSLLFILACGDRSSPLPRPHQYPRIDFPKEREPTKVQLDDCPFVLKIPSYASISKTTSRWEKIKDGACWFDIQVHPFDAAIHCSYISIEEEIALDKLIDDAFNMASKHNVKASHREQYQFQTPRGYEGVSFKIMGPVATPYQFYVTDKKNHFLRGSLYFNEKVERDSIEPVIEYLEKDVDFILASLDWPE